MDSLAIIALLLFVCAVSCGGWAIWAYLHRKPEPRSYGDEGGHPVESELADDIIRIFSQMDEETIRDIERVERAARGFPPSAWRGTGARRR